jgi:Flp pilus assembly protein TadB
MGPQTGLLSFLALWSVAAVVGLGLLLLGFRAAGWSVVGLAALLITIRIVVLRLYTRECRKRGQAMNSERRSRRRDPS